jgi:hypothetical protein
LATYQEIQRGWPSAKKQQEFVAECTTYTTSENGEQIPDSVDKEKYHDLCWKNTDLLFYMKWYRVIFDEVHSVKNVNSQSKSFSGVGRDI